MTTPKPPAQIAYLVDALGYEDALKLIETRGGTRLYIPRMFDPDGKLAEEFGAKCAKALTERWGNEHLKVPTCRWWRIRLYRGQGMNYAQIALKLGCTETTVWRSLNGAGIVPGQFSLPIE